MKQARMTAAAYRAVPAKRKQPEAAFQRHVAFYLSFALPPEAYWSAVGHGGGGRARGAKLMLMGVKPGVPDIFILHAGTFIGMELKSATGKLAPAQERAARKIETAGGRYYICRTIDDVIDALHLSGIPTRTRENLERFKQEFLTGPAAKKRRRSA